MTQITTPNLHVKQHPPTSGLGGFGHGSSCYLFTKALKVLLSGSYALCSETVTGAWFDSSINLNTASTTVSDLRL